METENKCCYNCDWFAPDYGTCCNGENPMCADFPPEPERHACEHWCFDLRHPEK